MAYKDDAQDLETPEERIARLRAALADKQAQMADTGVNPRGGPGNYRPDAANPNLRMASDILGNVTKQGQAAQTNPNNLFAMPVSGLGAVGGAAARVFGRGASLFGRSAPAAVTNAAALGARGAAGVGRTGTATTLGRTIVGRSADDGFNVLRQIAARHAAQQAARQAAQAGLIKAGGIGAGAGVVAGLGAQAFGPSGLGATDSGYTSTVTGRTGLQDPSVIDAYFKDRDFSKQQPGESDADYAIRTGGSTAPRVPTTPPTGPITPPTTGPATLPPTGPTTIGPGGPSGPAGPADSGRPKDLISDGGISDIPISELEPPVTDDAGGAGNGRIGGPGGPGGPGGTGPITDDILRDIASMRNEAANAKSPDVMGVFLSQGKGLIDLIDKQMAELRSQAEKEGREVDPGTQNMLDTLRKNLDDNIRTTQEDLNRRGLFHSGILLDLESKLRTGNASDQAKVLAERLARIQQSLSGNLNRLGGQKIQYAADFGMAGARGQVDADAETERRRDALYDRVIRGQSELRGQVSREEQERTRLAEDRRQFEASEALKRRLAEMGLAEDHRQFDENYHFEKAKFNTEEQRRQRELAAKLAGTMAKANASAKQPTRATPSGQGYNEGKTQAVAARVRQYPNRESALADIQTDMQALYADGVYVPYLIDVVNSLPSANDSRIFERGR